MSDQHSLNLRHVFALATAGILGLSGTSHGAIVVNNQTDVAPAGTPGAAYNPTTFASSATDLVNGKTGVVTYTGGTGSPTTEDAGGIGTWTNGSISTVYGGAGVTNATAHAAYGIVNATVGGSNIDTFVTYDLGGFYDITRVDVFMGWNDSGRDESSFNFLVSLDNITFTPVGGFAKVGDNTGAITTPVTNLHTIVDSGAAPIATGIRYVQLQFTDADNGYAGLAEFDVIGTAVPEPSAIILVGLGGLAAISRRRRG